MGFLKSNMSFLIVVLGSIDAVFSCGGNCIPYWITKMAYFIAMKKTDFEIEVSEYEEQWI